MSDTCTNTLKDEIKNELNKLNKFFLYYHPKDDNIGLYTGISGLCLLMCQNYLATKNELFFNKLNEYLDYTINFIEEGKEVN